jgi:hydroxypyruvate isomerase
MPRFAASLNLMFTEWPLLDRFAAARDAGFRAVEVQFPYSETPDAIARRLAETGLALLLIPASVPPMLPFLRNALS